MSRRRQPPLFEFLGAPSGRGTLTVDGNAMGRRPVSVPVARPASNGDSTQDDGAEPSHGPATGPERAVRIPVAMLALLIAGVVTLAAVIWAVAFSLGQQEKEKQLTPHLSEPTRSASEDRTSELPTSSQPVLSAPASPPQAPSQELQTAPPPAQPAVALGEDPRREGMNYLELCVLTFRDGEAAVQYLARNGVKAALVPAKSIDPAKARANNLPHVLLVADGIPSERFRASESDRKALEAKVEQIGKRWQREERGPSDFSRPVWRLFKGKE